MSETMDNIKEELKKLYSNEDLGEDDLSNMAKDLVEFFKVCIEIRERIDTSVVLEAKKIPGTQNNSVFLG